MSKESREIIRKSIYDNIVVSEDVIATNIRARFNMSIGIQVSPNIKDNTKEIHEYKKKSCRQNNADS
jgi:hypothetical protein